MMLYIDVRKESIEIQIPELISLISLLVLIQELILILDLIPNSGVNSDAVSEAIFYSQADSS